MTDTPLMRSTEKERPDGNRKTGNGQCPGLWKRSFQKRKCGGHMFLWGEGLENTPCPPQWGVSGDWSPSSFREKGGGHGCQLQRPRLEAVTAASFRKATQGASGEHRRSTLEIVKQQPPPAWGLYTLYPAVYL
ncbi:hypothetical protein HJG60_011906 [Phyllostomus discolor]|uniref:Uncharacterized protein n=1 Tax=Phyllostomus discolor TaxID=89673 RepID=A0A833ZPM0_9CHIR|nr:hypothetical protein HJG60_011906 [Phyllostomus discolor]